MPEAVLKKIELIKAWEFDGIEYEVGQPLEVDEDTAEDLIQKGFAKSLDEDDDEDDPDDDEDSDAGKPGKKKKKAASNDDDADLANMTVVELRKMLKSIIDEQINANARARRPAIKIGDRVIMKDGKRGFSGIGEFAGAVRKAASKVSPVWDKRLKATLDGPDALTKAPTAWGSTQSGEDGGFAVPPDFMAEIRGYAFSDQSLFAMTDRINVSGNSLSFPTDETTPWDTSNGVLVYWQEEGSQMTQSKIKLKLNNLRLKKIIALVPMTEEILEDAAALDSYLTRKAGQKLGWNLDNTIVRGNGSTQPLGWLTSTSPKIAVSRTDANTVDSDEVAAMYSRMIPSKIPMAVWVVSSSIYPELFTMSIANQPIFFPPGGFANAPFGTLLGRPIIPHQACSNLGTEGDINFVALDDYVTIAKSGGVKQSVSMHLWFDYDLVAYKFCLRVNGQPWASAAMQPPNSQPTQSSFVTLAAA